MNLSSCFSYVIFSTAILSSTTAFAEVPTRPGMASGAVAADTASTESADAGQPNQVGTSQASNELKKNEPIEVSTYSDGRVLEFSDLGMQITPPVGWEILRNSGGVSLILKEPQAPVEAGKTSFPRNITVATMHRSSPIDEQRAQELKEQLKANFSKDSLVTEYHVIEHKFFDYRAKNDGLLVYSSLKISEKPMMQMHVLVSGGDNQFLLTYTDLASRFNDQADKGFETAWKTMTSITVSGATPKRIESYYKYFALGGGLGFVGMVLMFLRRKAGKRDFDGEANELEESGEEGALTHSLMATLAYGWKFGSDNETNLKADQSEFHNGKKYDSAVSFVSNY